MRPRQRRVTIWRPCDLEGSLIGGDTVSTEVGRRTGSGKDRDHVNHVRRRGAAARVGSQSYTMELVFPRKDAITFEVVMNEESMDHIMVAVARKKAAKVMQKEERDLQKFSSILASEPAGKKFVADELAVVAESKEVAGDMISDVVLDQAPTRKVLSFKFVLLASSLVCHYTFAFIISVLESCYLGWYALLEMNILSWLKHGCRI
ncbi:hypothetical protein QYE76_071913 [Lolium multiflorum]|uniref:Uncharacterized protein n=1 Tax=Lolium multiflorum TaxID=4521 RepID=A0AAD8QA95_LOLMU|nr:hypothetical protein QYE76_071913 [Lolium multiflorum]